MAPQSEGGVNRPAPPVRRGLLAAAYAVLFAISAGIAAPLPAQPLRVGPDEEFETIGSAVAAARAGDTVQVAAGTYAERIRIRVPLTLLGTGWPVVDGGRQGHVFEAMARVQIEGFVIRGSGSDVDAEHAGVMVSDGPATRVVGNRLEDVFYGIYLKGSPGSLVQDNRIEGKPFEPPRRGDGIRLWYSSGTRVSGNEVQTTRDVVIYFSDSLHVHDNVIQDGRYGLHYMYSNHNTFERNRFDGNEVGAFLMYSADIRLSDNVFANSEGWTGMGLGLKDADGIVATRNLIVGNVIGIHLDNSPRSATDRNTFSDNLLLANEAGVRLLPSVQGNAFERNEFVHNRSPVVVAGGAGPDVAARNRWAGNFWGSYAGFDKDRNGTGDTPFVHARLSDHLLSRYPELGLFFMSPALGVLEVVSRFFPLLKPEPVAIDSSPRVTSRQIARSAGASMAPRPSIRHLLLWLAAAAAAGGALWRLGRGKRA